MYFTSCTNNGVWTTIWYSEFFWIASLTQIFKNRVWWCRIDHKKYLSKILHNLIPIFCAKRFVNLYWCYAGMQFCEVYVKCAYRTEYLYFYTRQLSWWVRPENVECFRGASEYHGCSACWTINAICVTNICQQTRHWVVWVDCIRREAYWCHVQISVQVYVNYVSNRCPCIARMVCRRSQKHVLRRHLGVIFC